MLLSRWQPFTPVWGQLQQLQSEMNRLFDRWGDGGTGLRTVAYPAVNIWEDAERVYLEAELPGLELKDLELHVTGSNQLTIKGERNPCLPEKAAWHRQERGFGPFTRVLTLPFDVDANKVDARLEHGVLYVQLAKHPSAKPRKITVKAD
jgi:HSP20 family protein